MLPTFVTHAPTSAEARDLNTLWMLARAQGLSSPLMQEATWISNGWLPSKTELEQSKSRAKRARDARLQKIRYDLKQLSVQIRGECSSFLKDQPVKRREHSSPVGVDQLSDDIQQLPDAAFSEADLATLSSEELEERLSKCTSTIDNKFTANAGLSSVVSSCASSLSNMSLTAQIATMLDETDVLEGIANQLASAHHASVAHTLKSSGMGCGEVRPGSVMINTALPTAIAEWLQGCLTNAGPLTDDLQEAGVIAIGNVYEQRKSKRILFLPGPETNAKDSVSLKMHNMMDALIEQQDGNKTADKADLTIYFDTDSEPTEAVGIELNTKFHLLVLTAARTASIPLEPSIIQMLEIDARRQVKLQEADETRSSVYEYVARATSRSGSMILMDPVTPSASRHSSVIDGWPGYTAPSDLTTPSLISTIVKNYVQNHSTLPSVNPSNSGTSDCNADYMQAPPAENAKPTLDEGDWDVVKPPQKKLAVPPAPPLQDKVKPKQKMPTPTMGIAPPMPRASDSNHPIGDPFEELTRPQPPSASLLEELEGRQPAAQRSRLPAISASAALNEHLACLAFEVDGLQPFEIFEGPIMEGKPKVRPAETTDDDSDDTDLEDERILDIGDCKMKDRHAMLYPYEKWHSDDISPTAYDRWAQQLKERRLLLDDKVIESLSLCMGKGQKLQYVGSTDGDLSGAIARHVCGSDDDESKKMVLDQLLEWLAGAGESFVFYNRPLREYVHWELTPPNIFTASNDWEELLSLLRESYHYLEYTAADWLLLIATAHVFAPVTVFHYQLARAVRFVKADATIEGMQRGYVAGSQLPSSSESWLVLGLLENGHFVRCRRKQLNSELMLQMIHAREEEASMESVDSGRRGNLGKLRGHAEKYDVKISDAALVEALTSSADNLDAAIERLRLPPRSAPDAVILQGPSGTGKSTWINLMAGKTEYDDTPPQTREGEWREPALAVLGHPLHVIGRGAEAETLHVSGTVIKTDDEATPFLEVLDTPGMFDTRGPLVEVVNAIFIAKCMPRFRTLRIVVMVREDTLKGRAEGFANTAETMAKLFATAGGANAVKKHVMLWINPHKPKGESDAEGVISKLKAIKGARPDIAEFIKMIISQSRTRKAVRVLEYEPEEATGDERDAIISARKQRYPDLDPAERAIKATIDRDEIVEQLMSSTAPMKNPGDKCGLPLTDQATAEIQSQVLKLQDFVALGCQLHDYISVRRYLDVLRSLCDHMRVGSEASGLMSQNKYIDAYETCITKVKARMQETFSKSCMEELCRPIGQPTPLVPSDLDGICISMRAAAAAAVLDGHLSLKDFSVELCGEIVHTQLQSVKRASCQLLDEVTDIQAAHRVFEGQIPHVLKTLRLVVDHFCCEASIADGATTSFARIKATASQCLAEEHEKIFEVIDAQARRAEEQIKLGVDEGGEIASRYVKMLAAEERVALLPAGAINPFEAAADALEVVKIAEGALAEFLPNIMGKYTAVRDYSIEVVQSQSQEVMATFDAIIASERNREFFESAMQMIKDRLHAVFGTLLFLLHARSSKLSKHCETDEDRARLDGCYADPVDKIVKLHSQLIQGVLEAARHDQDEFARTIGNYRPQVELAMELAKLAGVESIQLEHFRAMQPCLRWHELKDGSTKLTTRIEQVLMHFGSVVELRLKEHRQRVSRAEDAEEYDYAEHANELAVLEKARWCDRIMEEAIVEPAIAKVWHAFERHVHGLKSAVEKLREGYYKEARSLLIQTHDMKALCVPFLLDEPVDLGEMGAAARTSQSACSAARIMAAHDEIESMANGLIKDMCKKVQTKVIDRPGPMGNPEKRDWWMDLSICDANICDALRHLGSLLNMAKHLLSTSRGRNRLDEWLKLGELEKLQLDCRNRARELISKLVSRVSNFFGAVGSCLAREMDDAVALLKGEDGDGMWAVPSEGLCDDGKSEDIPRDDIPRDSRVATREACNELKDILQFLSRPSDHALVFEAARDPRYGAIANFDDLAFFRDLERHYQTSFSDCQFHFGNEETKPEARQKAIFIYSTFDRILPPHDEFSGFKKIFITHHNLLVQADQVAKREMSKELKGLLLAADFSEETRQLMLDSQALGKDDERARGPYIANCNVIVSRVQELLDSFDLATMHLKVPDPNFNVQIQLVKPWNQLQAAKANVAEFLKDSSAKSVIDLDQRLKQALIKFERVFNDEVLQQHARMFDMGDYRGAEGNAHSGFMRDSILVLGIQMAHGGELGQVARNAYDNERKRQKLILAELHVKKFVLKDAATLEQEGSFEEQACIIEDFIKESHARVQAINEIPGECELIVEYKQAAKLITDEVRSVISTEFMPLYQDQFLDLSKEHINFLDNLLARLLLAPFKEEALRMLPASISGGTSVDVAKQNIATFRDMHENVSNEAFSSLTPQKSDSIEAIKSKVRQQAEVLRTISVHNPRFSQIVNDFNFSAKEALERARKLMSATNPTTIPPGELEAVFAEVRERSKCSKGLKGITPQERAVEGLNAGARMSRKSMESWLLTSPQSLLANTTSTGDATLDNSLFGAIHTYLSLVIVAPVTTSTSAQMAQEELVSVKEEQSHKEHSILSGGETMVAIGQSKQHETKGKQVMDLLRSKLQSTLDMCFGEPVAPRDLTLKYQALHTLQRWEPHEGAGAQCSIFTAAIELEAAMLKEGTIADKKIVQPIHHEERKKKVYEDLHALITALTTELSRSATFVADQDQALDPKPFELVFSSQMDQLITYVGPDLVNSVQTLKVDVDAAAKDSVHKLQNLLMARKLKEADKLLQAWKFFEPLTQSQLLSGLLNLPGPCVFEAELQAHIDKLVTQAKTSVQTTEKAEGWQKQLCLPVLILGKCGSDIPRASAACKLALDDVLDTVESKFGAQEMQQLATELRERDEQLGQEIVRSSRAFACVQIGDFNRKTQRDISVVKQLYIDKNGPGSDLVWSDYEVFQREYDVLISKCTDDVFPLEDPLAYLVNHSKQLAGSDQGWIRQTQGRIPKVLAGIFAWWSMSFFEKLRSRNPHIAFDPHNSLQPNNVQVVCILKLLGGSSEMKNHLAEVPTGEGKSVILGVLATALALYGFDVDCVCYSSMLSNRDRDDFIPMFEAFKVLDRVRYGTFDTLSEDLLTEHYGDLRKAVADFLAKGKSTKHAPAPTTKRVLIIDEVDVFCSEAFFGGAYCPSLTVKNDEIAGLMRHIWSLRSSAFDIDELKRHRKYQAVLKSGILLPKNEWLLDRAVREMDKAARAYSPKMHDHDVRNGKIWYKVEGRDEYVDTVVYDYETNAEYLAEFEKGELTEQQMCEGLALHIRCGEFSFAKLPSLFKNILGVTGTLDAARLPPQMHDVLRGVGIKHFTYCPSMFHDSKRDWQPSNQAYVQVAKNEDEHYHMIVDEIDKRLMPTTQMDGQRSVLVFFRTEEEIIKFRSSSYFRKHKAERQVLTELSASRREDRDHLITRATRQGAVTLASRMYGRGTDFKIYNQRMEKAGGIHVIQTFFSRDLSEEIQIMGRSARQGDMGSYSQVLLSKQEGFDVTKETVEGWDPTQVHAQFSLLRADAGRAEVESLREMAKERMQEHEVLANSLKFFYHGQTDALDTLVRRYNSPGGLKVGANGIHVVFCLDESHSMSGAPWQELVSAFKAFWCATTSSQGPPMFVSIVQFGSKARVTHTMLRVKRQPPALEPHWSGTAFHPAVVEAQKLINGHGPMNGYTVVLVFMSDGHAADASQAAHVLANLAQQYPGRFESHTVGFGAGAPRTLESMAFANGQQDKSKYRAAAVGNLTEAFVAVAKSISPGRL